MQIRTLPALAAFLAAFCVSTAWGAASPCPANFFGGQAPDLVNPKLSVKSQALCYSEFAVLHSGLTRTPLWSADHLTADRVAMAKRQHRSDALDTFHEEPSLPPSDRATLQDYARSGFDRGHLSPNGDFDNPVAQGESFTLANMVPQAPENNRGIWANLEDTTRQMAREYGEVWAVTVPVFASGQTRWLRDRVAIPAKITKAVYIPSLNAAAVYVTENGPGSLFQVVSVAQLRDMSGIDAFPALPEQVKQTAFQLPGPSGRPRYGSPRSEVSPYGDGPHPAFNAAAVAAAVRFMGWLSR